jgi:hypothetical protein
MSQIIHYLPLNWLILRRKGKEREEAGGVAETE